MPARSRVIRLCIKGGVGGRKRKASYRKRRVSRKRRVCPCRMRRRC